MDGPTLVRAVKRLRPDMAVIFMSGYAEEAFRRTTRRRKICISCPSRSASSSSPPK
jgi:CheY-like chemotaxis protein